MTEILSHRFFTPEVLRDALQAAGYRVAEVKGPDGAPILTSATNGLPFELRLTNPLLNEAGGFADAGFQTAFQVSGELPLDLVNRWNNARRFARLHLLQDVLLLNMDVVALGGIAPGNLQAWIEIWDRLVQELIAYLREELPKLAKAAPVAEPAESKAVKPAEPTAEAADSKTTAAA